MKIDIPLLFLKGPVLAKELYGDLSLRTSSDLDVMIPIHKLGKSGRTASKVGLCER